MVLLILKQEDVVVTQSPTPDARLITDSGSFPRSTPQRDKYFGGKVDFCEWETKKQNANKRRLINQALLWYVCLIFEFLF